MGKEAPAEAEKKDGAKPAAAAKAPSPWLPIIVVVILMPAISFAVTNFVLLPKIRGAVLEQKAIEHAGGEAKGGGGKEASGGHGKEPAKSAHGKEAKSGGHGGHGKESKDAAGPNGFSYDFENIVVNLSGSMGTRYLKTSFTAFSQNADLKTVIEENKKQLLDTALGVLGSRSLADLEQPGAKNVVRNDLMANFNNALKSDLIDQIYFSEFVVQ